MLPASSLRNVGRHPLLDAAVASCPHLWTVAGLGTDPVKKRRLAQPATDAPLSAFVFKTIADPHAGRITLFRVYSGVMKSDSTVYNANREVPERLGALELLQGKTQSPIAELQAGDIGAVAKLKETQTNDTLCDKAHPNPVSRPWSTRDRPPPSLSSPRRAATTTRSRGPCTG